MKRHLPNGTKIVYDKDIEESMDSWMKRLGKHYQWMRKQYKNEKLMIVFDIDATIIDPRHMVVTLLQFFDHQHKTKLFKTLTLSQVFDHHKTNYFKLVTIDKKNGTISLLLKKNI